MPSSYVSLFAQNFIHLLVTMFGSILNNYLIFNPFSIEFNFLHIVLKSGLKKHYFSVSTQIRRRMVSLNISMGIIDVRNEHVRGIVLFERDYEMSVHNTYTYCAQQVEIIILRSHWFAFGAFVCLPVNLNLLYRLYLRSGPLLCCWFSLPFFGVHTRCDVHHLHAFVVCKLQCYVAVYHPVNTKGARTHGRIKCNTCYKNVNKWWCITTNKTWQRV